MKNLQAMPTDSLCVEASLTMKAASPAPIVDCATLLRGHRQAFITHDECIYVLRLTRGNKLILTK